MRSVLFALPFATFFGLAAMPASAEPVSCEQVLQMLSANGDPAEIATELDTTRARINACTKLAEAQDRSAERREELHRERFERGID